MAFATTLTADVGAADLTISVADNTDARTTYPWRAQIDDEVFLVNGGVEEGLDWTVTRGGEDTDPVTHLSGAAVTNYSPGGVTVTDGTTSVVATSIQMPSGTVSDVGGGTVAVNALLQIVTIPIAYNTPGITDVNGIELLALTAGQWLLDVCIRIPAAWNDGFASFFQIGVLNDVGDPTSLMNGGFDPKNADNAPLAGMPVEVNSGPTAAELSIAGSWYYAMNGKRGFPTKVLEDTALRLWGPVAPVSGTGEIVVFLATPS